MNRFRKMVSLILTAAMVAMLFTACGSNSTASPEATTAAKAEEKTEAKAEAQTEAKTAAQTESKEEEKPVLKIVRLESPNSGITEEGPELPLVESVTGYKVEVEFYDATTSIQKLVMDIAGGKEIDMVLTPTSLQAQMISQLTTLADSGAVYELGPIIDEVAPDLKAAFPQETWDACALDGKIYFVPSEGLDITQAGNVVRQDLLTQMGMEFPTSIDELINVLREAKAKDPAGVGAENVIPLSMMYPDYPFRAQYGVVYEFLERDGKLVSRLQTPEMKEYIAFLKQLYDEGLLDREFLTNKKENVNQNVVSGRVFMYGAGGWSITKDWKSLAEEQKINMDLKFMPTFEGPHGDKAVISSFGLTMGAFVPITSKHPEDAVKYLAEWAKEENFKTLYVGVEGVHHEVKDGTIYPILPAFNEGIGNTNLLMPLSERETYLKYWLPRTRKVKVIEDTFNDCYNTYMGESMIDPLGTALSFPTYSANKSSLLTLENEYIANVIMGKKSLDDYDEFLESWMKNGGEEAIKEVNEWYETHK